MSDGRTFRRHHPRKRMIQDAAAFFIDYDRPGVLDRPVEPGDDGYRSRGAP